MKLTEAQLERLSALENAEGRITPEQVVEDARQKSSPLHELFTWNVKEAAYSWWVQEAREILQVRVIVTTKDYTYRVPIRVRDPEASGAGYRSVVALKGDPVNARESVIYALQTATGHLRRAQDLAAALGLSAEIDPLLERVAGVRRVFEQVA